MFGLLSRGGGFKVDGSSFNGVDYIRSAAGLSGAADSKSGLASFWYRCDGGDLTFRTILHAALTLAGAESRFRIRHENSNRIAIVGVNAAGTTVLSRLTYQIRPRPQWIHFLASWDLNASITHFYVNDFDGNIGAAPTNSDIDYTVADWAVGAQANGGTQITGSLAEFFFKMGVYLDLSVEANRRKFITAKRKPANLGADGTLPGLGTPDLFFRNPKGGAASDFVTNRGTGGAFSLTGSLDLASSSPTTTEVVTKSVPVRLGTGDILRRTGLTGAALSKQFTFVFWCKPDHNSLGAVMPLIYLRPSSGTLPVIFDNFGGDPRFILQGVSGEILNCIATGTASKWIIDGPMGWTCILVSMDLSNAANRHVYFFDTPIPMTYNTYVNADAKWSSDINQWDLFGYDGAGASYVAGGMAGFWFKIGTYIDFSVEANRRKFVTALGRPVYLGSDGSLTTGVVPHIYLNREVGQSLTDYATNRGSGGNFTIVGGLEELSDIAPTD